MRALFFLVIPFLCAAQIHNEEEALALRRIADFWQEGEYQIAKSQIEEYLNAFPESAYSDTLCAALGDLFLRERNYSNALNCYSRIASKEWSSQVFLNRMQCLYHLEWYATLADECEAALTQLTTPEAALQTTYYLAISLYQQCLNASKNPEQLEKLALRAQPHFATLFQSELSGDVSQAFAHLCCILKDYSKASDIYLNLAQHDEKGKEDLLFQAAMLQAEFDKEKASQTFEEIANLGQNRAQDAAFNRLVLNFEMGHYSELASAKEDLLRQISPEKVAQARLFFGRSFLALKKYPEATEELKTFIETNPPYETLRAALVHLLDAAQQTNDLLSFDTAVGKLELQDPERPKALFARAILLKKERRIEEAKEQLTNLLSSHLEFAQRPQAAFELAHLEYQAKAWQSSREKAQLFVEAYSDHELVPFAWRYLASSSAQLAALEAPEQSALKVQLADDLERLLQNPHLLSEPERADWQFLLAKTYYELNQRDRSLSYLTPLFEIQFAQEANARLLMALLHREESLEKFCQFAEEALKLNADLVDAAQTHIALFNAYLERSKSEPLTLEEASNHLYSAFLLKGDLQPENLLWLAEQYYNRAEEDPSLAERAMKLLEQCGKTEATIYKLAKLYALQKRTGEQVALLEHSKDSLTPESQLLLAEGYVSLGKVESAAQLFDAIVASSPTIRSPISASASLQGIRLKKAKGIPASELALPLKNLIIQRSLPNEPIHLEAALDYIDLQAENDLEKRLSLLTKTKLDFESTGDLLSKDYQEARQKLPQKDQIYRAYISLIDADIFLCKANLTEEPLVRKELQAKAKDLLLQITATPIQDALSDRIQGRLQQLNIDEPSS